MRLLRQWFWGVVYCGWAALAFIEMNDSSAFAQSFNTTVTGTTLTDYSGFLVQPTPTPPSLKAQTAYRIENVGGVSVSRLFRVGFRILNGSGVAVPLTGAADESGTIVFSSQFNVALEGGGVRSGSAAASLTPAVSLGSGERYQVEAQLYVRQTALPLVFEPIGTSGLSDGYHFEVLTNPVEPAESGERMVGWLNVAEFSQAYAVVTIPGSDSFHLNVRGVVGRFDHLFDPVSATAYRLQFDTSVQGSRSGPIHLVESQVSVPITLASHAPDGTPAAFGLDQTIHLRPATVLDSTDRYAVTVVLTIVAPDNAVINRASQTLTGVQLLHFNGNLLFGSIVTVLQAFTDAPRPLGETALGEKVSIALPVGGATLLTKPTHALAATAGLEVVLGSDGTARGDGPVAVQSDETHDVDRIHGITFRREGILLSAAGMSANVWVQFPAGFGVTTSRRARRQLAEYPAGQVPLNAALVPLENVRLTPFPGTAALFAAHERVPVLFETTLMTWNVDEGTLGVRRDDTHYTRAEEIAELNLVRETLADPMAADRPSNEAYFLHPAASPHDDILIGADASGRAQLLDVHVELPPGSFTSHFPAGVTVAWSASGGVVWRNDAIVAAESSLPGASDASFAVSPRCPGDLPTAAPDDEFPFTPEGAVWQITPDGGLHAEGTISPTPVRWGAQAGAAFTHATSDFTEAGALVAGFALRGGDGTASSDNRVGELLLSGHGRPGEATYQERPGAPEYAAGQADYPGLNFRVGADGNETGTSQLGDQKIGPYALRGTSKYYARAAGISGRHEAVTASFAPFAGELSFYGFQTVLRNLQLSFLDNRLAESLVTGSVQVPGVRSTPGFAQPFARLAIDCQGAPGELTLPDPNNYEHSLAYWRARFHPITAEFRGKPKGAPAATPAGSLIFGAEVLLPGVVLEPLAGSLGFFADGRLVTAADGYPTVDSRLKLPKRVSLHGYRSAFEPTTSPGFTVHPVSKLYFNNPAPADAPADGFVAFAGTVDVPFFEDLKVHVLARATSGQTAIRGGWSIGPDTFFSNAQFDPANRGFPPGIDLDTYQNAAEPDTVVGPGHPQNPYNPRAHQTWFGFVDFDLPVTWDSLRRKFVSSAPEERDFLVLNSQRVLSGLTPSGADLRFGLAFPGLPRINLAEMVIDEKEATGQLMQHVPGGSDVVAAIEALDRLLASQSRDLVKEAVTNALDRFVVTLFQKLDQAPRVDAAADIVKRLDSERDALLAALQEQLRNITGPASGTAGLMKQFKESLDKVVAGLDAADQILKKDPATGKRGKFLDMTTGIGGLDAQTARVRERLDELINQELREPLDEVQRTVDFARSLVTQVRSELGPIQQALDTAMAAVNTPTSPDGLPAQALNGFKKYFEDAYDPSGSYRTDAGETRLIHDLRRIGLDAIQESGFVSELQGTVRNTAEPLRHEYVAAFNRITGTVNEVLRSAFAELGNELAEKINGPLGTANRAIGVFRDTLQLSQIDGHAHIEGDSLITAHINAQVGMRMPDLLKLQGSLDFERLRQDALPSGCMSGIPDGRMKITLATDGIGSLAGNGPAHIKSSGSYLLAADQTPLGVRGRLDIDNDLHLDVITLKHAEFAYAFGKWDNYLLAKGTGTILFVDGEAAAFLGRTCDPEVLKQVDPLFEQLLPVIGLPKLDADHPVTGFYFRRTGELPLNKLLGIPDDLLKLRGKGGDGVFAFSTEDTNFLLYGLRSRYGINVAIGPASADAEVNVLGALNLASPLRLLKTEGLPEIAHSLFDDTGLLQGSLTGTFKASFNVDVLGAKVGKEKEFRFQAQGGYTPPLPPAFVFPPPPGFFMVRSLHFD